MIPWIRNLSKEFLQTLYLRNNFMWRLPRDVNNAIGLTFDDGPDPRYTSAILDLLARYDVKATFFMIGNNVERHPRLVREIVEHGHAVGGHTHTHRVIVKLPRPQLEDELGRCRAAIQDATGVDTRLFRPNCPTCPSPRPPLAASTRWLHRGHGPRLGSHGTLSA